MATTDRDNANYVGELYLVGAYQTPFLSMIGGLNSGKQTKSFTFPVAQPYGLTAASQAVLSEDNAAAATTATTISRAQDYNTCQIMKYQVATTYAKQSTTGEISGLSIIGNQPVVDELGFQKSAAFEQMAIDVEYSFLQGTYVANGTSATEQATRGIIEATATNAVAAGSAKLSKTLIDEALRTMSTNGSRFSNMVSFVNGFQKQNVSDIYGYAPTDRNVGGTNIKQVETDFCMMGVVYAPQMPTDTMLIADMSVCYPVYCPYEGKMVFFQDTSITGAAKGGFWYTQIGLDYGPEEFHGKITGLATS